MHIKHNLKAFTLVELSIVIVIIGLIVAAVTAGQSLVRTSRMNAQIIDLYKFESGYFAFKLQYNAIPGDMRNASSYWAGSTDGNGDGRITQDPDNPYILTLENLKFFEHLSRAKLVPEPYTNVWQINVGYPSLKLNSRYGMVAGGNIMSPTYAAGHQLSEAAIAVKHIASLYLNVAYPLVNDSGFNDNLGVASPVTFAAIDRKMDDGAARTGKFQGYQATNSAVGSCLTGVDGNYLSTVTTDACDAEFIIAK